MNGTTVILILVLLVVAFFAIGAIIPSPVEEGNKYKIEQRANATSTAAAVESAHQVKLNKIEVDALKKTSKEQIEYQKTILAIDIKSRKYHEFVKKLSITNLSLALSIAVIGFSIAFVRKAWRISGQTYPNRAGQLPVERRIETDPKATWVNHNNQAIYGNDKKDKAVPPIPQLTAESQSTQRVYMAAVVAARQKTKGSMPVSDFLNLVNREYVKLSERVGENIGENNGN